MNEQTIFRALSDPTRRTIIKLLAQQPLTVTQITKHFKISRPAIAKHLGILESGKIISVTIRGRERINNLRPESLKTVENWLSQYSHFWDEKLHNLKAAAEKNQ